MYADLRQVNMFLNHLINIPPLIYMHLERYNGSKVLKTVLCDLQGHFKVICDKYALILSIFDIFTILLFPNHYKTKTTTFYTCERTQIIYFHYNST
jgi:hypothetical protein